ncbi:GntR family transcriptional regulator [Paenibacillus sp. LHD-117]|uniref:GntR family transcriptional regulator n=1 Tax=Paenibacillus sp. LHD-117 TaxID=3071412 RepID=UPI0027E186DF|nr:GntR family transcriptional regulator [Paenibacillus sp. LHD-117]MDQ6420237.1 GntR family transcriptional regulator [Paenibacillus sp. LHD-117]
MAIQSLVATAYTTLKDRIVRGQLMPGTLLSENELADELKMSRTPVRNAITHLESEGFVVSLKNRGVLVKEITAKESMDMYEAVMAMLVYTLDVKSERNIHLNMEKLEECLNRQIEAEKADDYLSYMQYSMQFMKAIISSIHNMAMLAAMESYVDKLAMAAYINFLNTPYIKHYSANNLNRSIFEALQKGDDEEARRLAKGAYTYARSRMFEAGRF